MNAKKARALRKQIGFVPSETRSYETMKIFTSLGRVKAVPGTKVNALKSKRAEYQALKRGTGSSG